METHPVFYDPTGQRRRLVGRLAVVLGLFCALATTFFVLSLLIIPFLPGLPSIGREDQHFIRSGLTLVLQRNLHLKRFLLHRSRVALWREIAVERARSSQIRPPARGSDIVAAFYAPWQETGINSLRANAGRLTHVMPEWLHLNRQGNGLNLSDWDPKVTPRNLEVVKIARQHHLKICPILNNAEGARFDPIRVHKLLASPKNQMLVAEGICHWLVRNSYDGLNLDLENLYPQDYARLLSFVHLLSKLLHKARLSLSVDIEADAPRFWVRRAAEASDFAVLMAYDEHSASEKPGPIASIAWYYRLLRKALKLIPPSKLVVGLGNYAYDWPLDGGPAEELTYQSALVRARDYRPDEPPSKVVDFDPDALNTTFEYADDAGREHEVWMLDAVSAYNQWKLAVGARIRGAALWVLGSEDPSLWLFLDRHRLRKPPSPKGLEKVCFPYEIEFEGEGEILSVHSLPQEGRRRITVDDATGLCTDMSYLRYPSSFLVKRTGYRPREVALTFDDGPDPIYTPKILNILRQYGVRATFFVIGENAERHPSLVRRELYEGHEIGNHTFTHPNMAAVTDRRAMLELNATQRVLEAIIGRSTLLFRPPYNADAEPASGEELMPILRASKLGYIVVGELVDPQDWNLWRSTRAGQRLRRTPREIAGDILRDLHSIRGNIVLLHDSGGDRSATVAALRIVIPKLLHEGYRFVTVSQLLGITRDAVMPRLANLDKLLVGFDKIVFWTTFVVESLLTAFFTLAILLGIGRVLFVVALALASKLRTHNFHTDGNYRPHVSVLIAAYNERVVIARTIHSILQSKYENLEVVVVDDGSQDGTGDEVLRVFGNDPRVRLIKQANSGKATALNRAIENARGEVLVCLDADTLVLPNTISLLVRHFSDPSVAAVAGNVKVGNRINILTRWQAIEYITSQNLDRRAYALLNAVTVVPGAVGAWRRSAVQKLGGYTSDTMAEDMDLTWRLRRHGWRIDVDGQAVAFTEAPDNLRAFAKQRFRWSYGTLQCLWKHRDALFHYGWFGWLALPSMWVFQVLFQLLAPVVDLKLFYAVASFANSWVTRGILRQDWQPLPHAMQILLQTGFFYALFFAVELLGAFIAFHMDQENKGLLWWLGWQKLVYRQIMYAVLWKSVWTALKGVRLGWGKLHRKGTVRV
jgi:poly-beta-1,6 N-acetyl-D-glucosamine synthase